MTKERLTLFLLTAFSVGPAYADCSFGNLCDKTAQVFFGPTEEKQCDNGKCIDIVTKTTSVNFIYFSYGGVAIGQFLGPAGLFLTNSGQLGPGISAIYLCNGQPQKTVGSESVATVTCSTSRLDNKVSITFENEVVENHGPTAKYLLSSNINLNDAGTNCDGKTQISIKVSAPSNWTLSYDGDTSISPGRCTLAAGNTIPVLPH